MTKLIVGCGYLGRRVAQRWLALGESVACVTHRLERAEELEREGLRAIVADVTRPDTLSRLPAAETVLYAVGYERGGRASRRELLVDGLRAVLDALPDNTGRILFTSSTGVYEESGGRWVDEDSPCRPTRMGGRVMLAAEEVLAGHRLWRRAIILRLAGLYGPDRLPRLADLVAGKPLVAPAQGYLNLIHVDDAASVIVAAEKRARPPRTYVVSDGHPTQQRVFCERLAGLLDLPRPRFVEPSEQAGAAPRATTDKRVSNARMLAELGVELQFPAYWEGLAAIVGEA